MINSYFQVREAQGVKDVHRTKSSNGSIITPKSINLKPAIIALHNQGKSNNQIAKELHVNRALVAKTVQHIGKTPIAEQPKESHKPLLASPNSFKVMSANEYVDSAFGAAEPKHLFDCLVIENEITVLFAPTNVGKSILSVQIADSISRGKALNGFSSDLTRPMRVLYADFELSDLQFGRRYFDKGKCKYKFANTFFRAVQERDVPTDVMIENLRKALIETQSEVLIFDNISFLGNRMHCAEEGMETIKALRNLRDELGITMVIVAHTNKKDNKPLSINDLAGTSKIGNLIDAAFAIGNVPSDKGLRYIKQLKSRSVEKKYEDPVIVAELDKNVALAFKFRGLESESKLLKAASSVSEEELQQRIWELSEQGYSSRKIESELGVSKSKVCNIIKLMKERMSNNGQQDSLDA